MPSASHEGMMTNSWTTVLEQDPDDPEGLILNFPDDMLELTGWKPGDILVFELQEDQSITIRKK